jgi:class 3 adenylate cyclase
VAEWAIAEHQDPRMAQAPEAPDTFLIDTARAALGRHEWRAAFDALSKADGQARLEPEALELLAQAAWWTGQLPEAIDARERAFAAAIKSGNTQSAAIAGINLARDNLMRMKTDVSQAWIKRVERMLEGVEENEGHGWLAIVTGLHAALTGDNEQTLVQATRAYEIGKRLGVMDLEAFALAWRASALIAKGEVEEGLALADEAALIAISGELEPSVAGGVFCVTIEACAGIGDVTRASEWTDAQDRWCRREGINGYPGMCRLFRSDVKRFHGAWPEAEAEARLASVELRGFIPAAAGLALYQVGEIRLRRGDLPAAEEALLGVHGLGQDTEPLLSLLRLAQGKVAAAAESINRAATQTGRSSWRAPTGSALYRLSVLPAQVEILLAAGDVAGARTAGDELNALADRFATPAARAAASTASGALALAEGDAATAAERLREAIGHWGQLDAPYDVARSRIVLAEAYLAQNELDRAAIEARTARDAFERLGAALDLRKADAILEGMAGAPDSQPLGMATTRTVRVFMFTDIVDSTRLAEVMGDAAWDQVTRIHDQLLRGAVAEQGGEEVKATGDGFFLAFADADEALQAAVAIQRRLAAHREAQGFVPTVRIGIHRAEANRVGLDYTGAGVNQASRIGGAANGDEVLVSAATLGAARHSYSESGRRTVELKGISAPVEVVSIDWK